MIKAAPRRFAAERITCSSSWSPVGWIPILSVPVSSLVASRPSRRGIANQRLELCVSERDEVRRLERPLGLPEHHLDAVLLEQRDRVELGIEGTRDGVRLRKCLSDECEPGRQRDPVLERHPLQVGQRLARLDPRERPPVVTGELPAEVVDETGLVGGERLQRQSQDQVGDVVGAVLGDREQEQAERPPGVVVEPAEQPEVDQCQAPVGREQDVPAVRVRVVDAVLRDLLDVGAEELRRKLLRSLAVENLLAR